LCQDPGKRKLRRRASLLAGNLANALDQVEVVLKIFALKSWRREPEIVFLQILWLSDFAGQKSATERAVRYETDSQLTAHTEHFRFRVARPE
jgi:hypothetical protein